MLSSEIEEYKNIVKERRERESKNKNDDEFEDKPSNSIDIIAWNECAQFLNVIISNNDNDQKINNNIDNTIIHNKGVEISISEGMRNINDQYANVMKMIDEEMRRRGLNKYISDNND
eukprot:384148_1